MKQYKLEMVSDPKDFDGGTMLCKRLGIHHIAWIDEAPELKRGDIISLKGRECLFVVDEIFDTELEKADIKRGWKVGGL